MKINWFRWCRRAAAAISLLFFPIASIVVSKLDAFSRPGTAPQPSVIPPDFAYTGLFYHQRSGLCFAEFRVYDSGLKRWINRDPIGENGGINLYGYVGNRPTIATDPSGNDSGITPVEPNRPQVPPLSPPLTPVEPNRPGFPPPGGGPSPTTTEPKRPQWPPSRKECHSLH
ncbi:MAG TPA: RHS repeat-associated core domain-containing protein [Chthoniobacterales bacterium]|nr:RHS repeat-associated core domain-containing protein [Chthoniobacterales bacterium]